MRGLYVFSLLLMLTACGGGSGDEELSSTNGQVVQNPSNDTLEIKSPLKSRICTNDFYNLEANKENVTYSLDSESEKFFILENGSSIRHKDKNIIGEFEIKVTAKDGDGNSTEKSINIVYVKFNLKNTKTIPPEKSFTEGDYISVKSIWNNIGDTIVKEDIKGIEVNGETLDNFSINNKQITFEKKTPRKDFIEIKIKHTCGEESQVRKLIADLENPMEYNFSHNSINGYFLGRNWTNNKEILTLNKYDYINNEYIDNYYEFAIPSFYNSSFINSTLIETSVNGFFYNSYDRAIDFISGRNIRLEYEKSTSNTTTDLTNFYIPIDKYSNSIYNTSKIYPIMDGKRSYLTYYTQGYDYSLSSGNRKSKFKIVVRTPDMDDYYVVNDSQGGITSYHDFSEYILTEDLDINGLNPPLYAVDINTLELIKLPSDLYSHFKINFPVHKIIELNGSRYIMLYKSLSDRSATYLFNVDNFETTEYDYTINGLSRNKYSFKNISNDNSIYINSKKFQKFNLENSKLTTLFGGAGKQNSIYNLNEIFGFYQDESQYLIATYCYDENVLNSSDIYNKCIISLDKITLDIKSKVILPSFPNYSVTFQKSSSIENTYYIISKNQIIQYNTSNQGLSKLIDFDLLNSNIIFDEENNLVYGFTNEAQPKFVSINKDNERVYEYQFPISNFNSKIMLTTTPNNLIITNNFGLYRFDGNVITHIDNTENFFGLDTLNYLSFTKDSENIYNFKKVERNELGGFKVEMYIYNITNKTKTKFNAVPFPVSSIAFPSFDYSLNLLYFIDNIEQSIKYYDVESNTITHVLN